MTAYGRDNIALIDERVDAAAPPAPKVGTVISRDTASELAVVSFDGSSGIPQPVKCFETVVADVGDRVGLVKFEGEWIVVGSYAQRTLGEATTTLAYTSTSTTTSASFVDMPSSPRAVLPKYRDGTTLLITLGCSLWASATPTVVEVGVNLTFPDGTTTDVAMFHRALNAASDHRDVYGMFVPNLTLVGGTYGVTCRWRRVSGTGTLTMDLNDSVSLNVREVF